MNFYRRTLWNFMEHHNNIVNNGLLNRLRETQQTDTLYL